VKVLPLQEACSGFLVAAYDSKSCPNASHDMYTGKNQPTKEKESRNRNSDAAFGTVFKINKCFQKTSRKVRFEYKIYLRMCTKYYFNYIALKKYLFGDKTPL
jgi:hypothetical protein